MSLGRIAQQAGVGAGTVYRHFPSKETLVEAVFAEHIEGLAATADRWAARTAPGDALFEFLLEVIGKSAGRKPVCMRSPLTGAGRAPCWPPRGGGTTRRWTACCGTRSRRVRYAPTTWPRWSSAVLSCAQRTGTGHAACGWHGCC